MTVGTRGATDAAIGFRAHSGWAVAVAVAGPLRAPVVIASRRIELIEAGFPRQPYHTAEKMDLADAEKLLKRCTDCARLLARHGLRAIIDELQKQGHRAVAAGIVLASGRPPPSLAATLASHALIHTAEGVLFRDVLAHASKRCRLPVSGVPERDLFTRAEAELRISADKLRARLAEMGRSIGPPWTQDQKHATLVAWLALAAR